MSARVVGDPHGLADLFVAPDAHGNPGVWRNHPGRPDYPTCVLEEFYVKDADLWNAIVRLVEGRFAFNADMSARLTGEEVAR